MGTEFAGICSSSSGGAPAGRFAASNAEAEASGGKSDILCSFGGAIRAIYIVKNAQWPAGDV